MSPRVWIAIAALSGAVSVAIGAYHAHGLESFLEKQTDDAPGISGRMENCATAVRYQMFHTFALLVVGLLSLHVRSRLAQAAGVLFVLGMLGFSGGLYLHVFAGTFIHWSIVPAGGVLLIAGWVVLAIAGLTLRRG